MTTFVILAILVVLFVIGSASALRYFDRYIPKQKRKRDKD